MASTDRPGWPRHSERASVLLCAALLVAITLLRVEVHNPDEAVGFLYVIPISLVAAETGLRNGVLAATAAIVLTVLWAAIENHPVVGYVARTAAFLSVGVFVGLQAEQRRRLQAERERLIRALDATAMRDALTELPNRRAWDERLGRELSRAASSGRAVTVIAIDLDGLKQINDTHGHEQGDRLIQRCAHAWTGALGESNFLARVGGDEFMVLLPGWSPDQAWDRALRLIGAVPFNKSCSAGVATWDHKEAAYELVHRAHQATHAAKQAGGSQAALAAASIETLSAQG